jgi:DNA-binding Lrp family transcriptional regulator
MDKLDLKIVSILLDNCRESDRQIGNKIGISGNAVKSRIERMLKNGVIESFALKIEPPVLGFSVLYVVTTGQDIDGILKQIRLVGDPFFVVPCVGGITVCAIVVKDDVQQKIEIVKNLMRDVKVLSIFEAENPGIRSDLTKTDLEIINHLLEDPKLRIEEIAKLTDLSTKTVTRSLKKLQNDEVIQFTLVYNPEKFDQYIPFAVLVWIESGLKDVLGRLKKQFSDAFLQKPFIAKNQVVLFFYSNNIFELDNIVQQVREINGVSTADLFIPRQIKFPQNWARAAINTARSSERLHLVYQK